MAGAGWREAAALTSHSGSGALVRTAMRWQHREAALAVGSLLQTWMGRLRFHRLNVFLLDLERLEHNEQGEHKENERCRWLVEGCLSPGRRKKKGKEARLSSLRIISEHSQNAIAHPDPSKCDV
ncbi:hypothetical protein VTI74DRAFT_9405 [Chaetomium olivicolor]